MFVINLHSVCWGCVILWSAKRDNIRFSYSRFKLLDLRCAIIDSQFRIVDYQSIPTYDFSKLEYRLSSIDFDFTCVDLRFLICDA